MTINRWHVAVVVPARNEEILLARCLESVLAACSSLPPHVTWDIVVAIDSSTDRSLRIASKLVQGFGIVIQTDAGVVGRVRALTAEASLQRYSGRLDRCWLANTDADCSVPSTWLNDQLRQAVDGVEAIAGTVDVDCFREHDLGVAAKFRNSYLINPDGSHPHVHGANLGVRADAYLRAGGWRSLSTAEDHDLWVRLLEVKSKAISVATLKVLTSGRRVGRAPLGFAAALSAHNAIPPLQKLA